MARDLRWLLERIDTESPGDSNIAPGATEATLHFIVEQKYLFYAYQDILGLCTYSSKVWAPGLIPAGGLSRRIEMSHPRFPYMYADRIDIVGVKQGGQVVTDLAPLPKFFFDQKNEEVQYRSWPYGSIYDTYRIAVRFTTRNYFLLTDEQLEKAIVPEGDILPRLYWYWRRDVRNRPGVRSAFYYDYREYLRYTEMTVEPHNEVISNSNGKLYWKSEGPGFVEDGPPWPRAESPVQIENAPVIFQNITKNLVKIKWHKVPKLASLNPQYILHAGKINYGPNYDDDAGDVRIWNYEFFNFAPGTLLFLGHEVEDVTTGMPFVPFDGDSADKLWSTTQFQQYCNITFNFMQFVIPEDVLVKPVVAFRDAAGNLVEVIANAGSGKMYSNGWNFVPNPNKSFYYIESDSRANRRDAWPPYWSYPFQRLFNPLVDT